MILLDSNSNFDAMACLDMKLFHSYNGAAEPVFTRIHDCEYYHSSLLPWYGAAAIRDFRFVAELCFLGINTRAVLRLVWPFDAIVQN